MGTAHPSDAQLCAPVQRAARHDSGHPWPARVRGPARTAAGAGPDADGYLLRLLNAADHAEEAQVRFKPAPGRVLRVTLDGATQQSVTLEGDIARLGLRPWEIATLRVSR